MEYVFCCRGPIETCLRVVGLSSFHFVPSVWPTKAAGESAECADGADGISGRRQFCPPAAGRGVTSQSCSFQQRTNTKLIICQHERAKLWSEIRFKMSPVSKNKRKRHSVTVLTSFTQLESFLRMFVFVYMNIFGNRGQVNLSLSSRQDFLNIGASTQIQLQFLQLL